MSENQFSMTVVESNLHSSPLARLSEEEFENRLTIAKVEIERIKKVQRAVMEVDVDYGVIPGTNKPSLWQPGAQILNRMAGLRPEYQPTVRYGDGDMEPAISVTMLCRLIDQGGNVVSESLGAANTHERKHRYRTAIRVCPRCGGEFIFQSKQGDAKWFCWRTKGGCGANFKDGSEECAQIDVQSGSAINPDPYDLENTVVKMAAKRAYLGATLNAHAASGIFTQDVEDEGPEEPEEPVKKAQPAKPAQKPAQASKASAPSEDSSTPISEGRVKSLWAMVGARLREIGHESSEANKQAFHDTIIAELGVTSFKEITSGQFQAAVEKIKAWE